MVFVHGLTGNRETTWTHKSTKIFWPSDLLPKDLPDARILSFGYDADVVRALDAASSNSLRDHGKSLAHELAMNKMRARAIDRPTFFVAHSLGGLVCEQVMDSVVTYITLLIIYSGSVDMPKFIGSALEHLARGCERDHFPGNATCWLGFGKMGKRVDWNFVDFLQTQ